MAIQLHQKEDLSVAANTADLPVAFLVGAPLAIDATGGVPAVRGMLDVVRDEIRARACSPTSTPIITYASLACDAQCRRKPPNKGMKLTSAEHIGRSQLIPGVRRTNRR